MKTQDKNHNPRSWEYVTALLFIVSMTILMIVNSCSPRLTSEISNDTKTEYKEKIVWRDTTLYVPVPLGTGEVITHVGDTAKTETSVAKAEAWVDNKGELHLHLENLKTTIPHQTKIPSRDIWMGVTNTQFEKLTKIEYRDKPLSAWKSAKLSAFWWLVAALGAALLWILRKPILRLLKIVV